MAENGIAAGRPQTIEVAKIKQNAVALRDVKKDSVEYQELVDSVRSRGVLQSILVREFPNPENPSEMLFGLIDGLQRYNAALDAGLRTIPANIVDMDQAQIEEVQIVANVQRIETRLIEYAQQIERLLQRNPTMGMGELSSKLNKSTTWIYKVLGLNRNLNEDLKKLVDEKKIPATNAYELSKLPHDEQPEWLDKAIQMPGGEFTSSVANRLKQIKEARQQGRRESQATFEPTPNLRKLGEISDELTGKTLGASIISRNKLTTAQQGWEMAIAWVMKMDPDSQAEQIEAHNARQAAKQAETDKRKLERLKQKQEEAAKVKADLEEKVRAKSNEPKAPTPAEAVASA